MSKLRFLGLILCVWTTELGAQPWQDSITVPIEPDPHGGSMVALCCTPSDLFRSPHATCAYRWTRQVGGNVKGTSFSMAVKLLCDELQAKAQIVAMKGDWFISSGARPDQAVFRVNCESTLAWPLTLPDPPAQDPQPPSPAASPDPAASSASPQALESGSKDRQAEKVLTRLRSLEKALAEHKTAVQSLQEELKRRSTADQDLEKKLEALRTELLEKLKALDEAHKNICYRIDDEYQGKKEVTVAVAGSVLRFLEVQPRSSEIAIGLSEAKARELLAEAQAASTTKIFPHIYLAVPEAVRKVEPFFLQDRLIDPQLYSRLTGGKDASRVSYQDVSHFIAELNARCAGRVTFALPSEEELVAAAQRLYDPVADGLKPCDALRKENLRSAVTELFGHAWQLTRSVCQTFNDPPKSCPDSSSSYVRKGGAVSSTNPLECMPEYRLPAPFDVNQKETSFRLALTE